MKVHPKIAKAIANDLNAGGRPDPYTPAEVQTTLTRAMRRIREHMIAHGRPDYASKSDAEILSECHRAMGLKR